MFVFTNMLKFRRFSDIRHKLPLEIITPCESQLIREYDKEKKNFSNLTCNGNWSNSNIG